ncbi:MAG: hypothetical protein LBE31_07515, partial [Deltaproteobacteria bacterium]|nr:hypothetical protein [Deltaproteobacteria bacterium]
MTNKYKIFIAIFLPASLALIIGLAIIDQRNRQLGQAQFEEQLQSQWLLVSAIQKSLPNNSEFKNLCQSLDLRVTLVAEGGQVLLDTGADEEAMEDHSQREEIRNAFLGVPTTAIRESRTTRVHTIYYAKLVQP